MGFFDFLDARIGIARWAVKCFRNARRDEPNLPTEAIIGAALHTRYCLPLGGQQAAILRDRRVIATDIYGLCHLVAEVELLSHLDLMDRAQLKVRGKGIVAHTFGEIDGELKRLGF